jgi:hypothetical protein
MAIDFQVKDIIHRVTVKFVQAFLPGAKKKYNAKVVLQTELDVHGIASKAEVYNITTPPKVIEEGFNAALELIRYLVADGFKINTKLFNIHLRVRGEYDGTETHLPDGVYPEVGVTIDAPFRQYVQEHVQVVFDGVEENNGLIGQIIDSATGLIDQVITIDNVVTIHGFGLKVEADAAHTDEADVFFQSGNGTEIPAKAIARNESRTLAVVSPVNLVVGESYFIIVRTQSSVKHGGNLLVHLREVKSDFTLVAQA